MRILVTGGTGFIGRWAASVLVAAGHEVFVTSRIQVEMPQCRVIVGDLLQPETHEAILALAQPEILLHLAWYVDHGKFWNAAENLDWTIATVRLVSAAQRWGVRRIVCAGTCMEYDLSLSVPCKETSTAIRPATLYAVAKDATRRLVEEFAAINGIGFAWGRLFFLFGPNEHPNRLVPVIVASLLSRRPALISSGTQIRDFMDVRDAGAAFAALALSKVTGGVNIASGQALQIREIAEEIQTLVGGVGELRFGAMPNRPNEPANIFADVSRMRDEVGFLPVRTMQERLAETIEWWRKSMAERPTGFG